MLLNELHTLKKKLSQLFFCVVALKINPLQRDDKKKAGTFFVDDYSNVGCLDLFEQI